MEVIRYTARLSFHEEAEDLAEADVKVEPEYEALCWIEGFCRRDIPFWSQNSGSVLESCDVADFGERLGLTYDPKSYSVPTTTSGKMKLHQIPAIHSIVTRWRRPQNGKSASESAFDIQQANDHSQSAQAPPSPKSPSKKSVRISEANSPPRHILSSKGKEREVNNSGPAASMPQLPSPPPSPRINIRPRQASRCLSGEPVSHSHTGEIVKRCGPVHVHETFECENAVEPVRLLFSKRLEKDMTYLRHALIHVHNLRLTSRANRWEYTVSKHGKSGYTVKVDYTAAAVFIIGDGAHDPQKPVAIDTAKTGGVSGLMTITSRWLQPVLTFSDRLVLLLMIWISTPLSVLGLAPIKSLALIPFVNPQHADVDADRLTGGGVVLVQALQKQINSDTHQLVVIEKRDYHAHWPALIVSHVLRGSVTSQGSVAENSLIPFDRAFDPSVRLVHSGAKQITSTEVITESGERVTYSHLVLATGSLWNGALALPDSRDQALDHLNAFRRQLEAAENVVILGGGAVGIEYAGELAHYYPDKKVSLVHALPKLTNDTYPAKFRDALLEGVTKLGIQVILGDRLLAQNTPKDGYVTTNKGVRLRADLVVCSMNCAGHARAKYQPGIWRTKCVGRWGYHRVARTKSSYLFDHAKWLKNNEPNQMVFKASMGHAPIVAGNIIASINGGKQNPYQGKPEMILITLGPKGGRGNIPFLGGIVVGDWVATKAKSASLFISNARTTLGYGPPKAESAGGVVLLAAAFFIVPVAYVMYLNGLLSA
ncbi:pyridine nucleotide-disulfide oxidoreductase domain-containing protein [Rhizoctonia solani AG-1 IA]|uniref:Pyridine nucleotide-disulfide oxidoreductase domain-containing protein n=1 Tax=Thanatephorus cucumeris (strain AG1-IA) TaxID=983506 RepID=L8WZA7_THACA|nr:pyridine nucleotide-disulfide oxidoreductase domain-containing protein [Rhizoctonia solani AG-1 IA]